MRFLFVVTPVLLTVVHVSGQVVSYEGNSFPEADGWQRIAFCTPQRAVENGLLVQSVGVGECGEPPGGDYDVYTRDIGAFEGVTSFFVEFRMRTDGNQSEIVGQAPAAVAAGSFGPVSYRWTIARDQVKLLRDVLLPILFIDITPDEFHTYRLELHEAKSYAWYVDGAEVNSGSPEGAYPSAMPFIPWGAMAYYLDSTTEWDYFRYGTIPSDASGDFDSNNDLDLYDFYFVHECLFNGAPGHDAGPGCRFADVDGDTDVDLHDFALFQNAFRGAERPGSFGGPVRGNHASRSISVPHSGHTPDVLPARS